MHSRLAHAPFIRLVLLLGACLIAGSIALADDPGVALVDQDRSLSVGVSVDAGGGGAGDGDQDAAVDFGPYDASINANANDGGIGGSAFASAWASQSSTLGTGWVRASGSASLSVYIYGSVTGWGHSRSESNVVFDITAYAEFSLQGTLDAFQGRSWVQLIGPEQQTIHGQSAFWEVVDVDRSGTLAPGRYELRIGSYVEDGGWGGQMELGGTPRYDLTFALPAAGFTEAGGEVPDGDDQLGGEPLRMERLDPYHYRLSWGPSCRLGDTDYAVYVGELGVPSSLGVAICSTEGAREQIVTGGPDAAFYIVVPHDGVSEGSYGDDSEGDERLPTAGACFPQALGEPVCP